MSLQSRSILLRKASRGSSTLAFVFRGRIYCHCAVPTWEQFLRIEVIASQTSSKTGSSVRSDSYVQRRASSFDKNSCEKHFCTSAQYLLTSVLIVLAFCNTDLETLAKCKGFSLQSILAFAMRDTKGCDSTPMA